VRNNKIGLEDFHFENWTDCQVSFRKNGKQLQVHDMQRPGHYSNTVT